MYPMINCLMAEANEKFIKTPKKGIKDERKNREVYTKNKWKKQKSSFAIHLSIFLHSLT